MSNPILGDNLHEMSNPDFWENKKNILIILLSTKDKLSGEDLAYPGN